MWKAKFHLHLSSNCSYFTHLGTTFVSFWQKHLILYKLQTPSGFTVRKQSKMYLLLFHFCAIMNELQEWDDCDGYCYCCLQLPLSFFPPSPPPLLPLLDFPPPPLLPRDLVPSPLRWPCTGCHEDITGSMSAPPCWPEPEFRESENRSSNKLHSLVIQVWFHDKTRHFAVQVYPRETQSLEMRSMKLKTTVKNFKIYQASILHFGFTFSRKITI